MTNFGWWHAKAAENGKFMCEICFDAKSWEEAHEDAEGQRWTVCRGECAAEAGMIDELVAEAEQGYDLDKLVPRPKALGPGSNEHGKQWGGYLSRGFLGGHEPGPKDGPSEASH